MDVFLYLCRINKRISNINLSFLPVFFYCRVYYVLGSRPSIVTLLKERATEVVGGVTLFSVQVNLNFVAISIKL